MKLKTQTIVVLGLVFISFQLLSCEKDSAVGSKINSNNNIANSVSDSLNDSTSSSLIAWYTFNGDLLDHSMYKNNVNFNSAVAVTGAKGEPNTAYLFNGSSSYMTVPSSASLNPDHGITLAVLLKPTGFYKGTFHANRVFQKGFRDQSDGAYFIGYDDLLSGDNTGSVADSLESFYGTYGDNQFSSIGARDTSDFIEKGKWYVVIFTVDATRTGKLYVNGVLKNTVHNAMSSFTPNNDDLYIGRDENSQYPFWFHGVIDEIRIYNRAYNLPSVSAISKNMVH